MRGPNALGIVESAMELRSHNPAGWDKFVAAVADYATQVLSLTLAADPAVVMRAQGMAIQAAEIVKILQDAPQLYAAAQAGRQNHANRKPAVSNT